MYQPSPPGMRCTGLGAFAAHRPLALRFLDSSFREPFIQRASYLLAWKNAITSPDFLQVVRLLIVNPKRVTFARTQGT